MEDVFKSFSDLTSGSEPYSIPAAIYGVATWCPKLLGYSAYEYFSNKETKLEAMTRLQKDFADALLIPGIWPDFGLIAEAASFGGKILWSEDDPPYIEPALADIKDVDNLKPPNYNKDGLFPQMLEEYSYMRKNTNEDLISGYGHVEGTININGPLETAALVRGYDDFLMDFIRNPQYVHKLLRIVTETLLEWIRFYENYQGVKISRFCMSDHFPTMVSPVHFKEFCLPYMQNIFSVCPSPAVKIYHNDGGIEHLLDQLPQTGMDIVHSGIDFRKAFEVNDSLIYMGNLPTLSLIQKGNPEDVKVAVKELITTSPKHRLIVSASGEFADGTPRENVRAMIEALKQFS